MGVGGEVMVVQYTGIIVLYSVVLISYLVDVITCLSQSGGKKKKERSCNNVMQGLLVLQPYYP